MKKYLIILGIAVIHFVVTKMVSLITLSVFTANVNETQISPIGHFLMLISRVLYFPVMTMAWYPRRFFPGDLVVIPLFINSLIWALLIYLLFMFVKRWFPGMK
jgi:hypothetical protein